MLKGIAKRNDMIMTGIYLLVSLGTYGVLMNGSM